jgi:hypothetical protein
MNKAPSDLANFLVQKSALFCEKNTVLDGVNFASKLGKNGAVRSGC